MSEDTKIGVMQPQAKHCWQPQKLEEARTGSSLEPLEGGGPAGCSGTLISNFWLQNCQ